MEIQIYVCKIFPKFLYSSRVGCSVKYRQKKSSFSSSHNATHFSTRSRWVEFLNTQMRHTCMQSIELEQMKKKNVFNWWKENPFQFHHCVREKFSFIAWITWMIMKTTSNKKMICFWSFFFLRLFTCNFHWFFLSISKLVSLASFQRTSIWMDLASWAINFVCHNLTDFFFFFFTSSDDWWGSSFSTAFQKNMRSLWIKSKVSSRHFSVFSFRLFFVICFARLPPTTIFAVLS